MLSKSTLFTCAISRLRFARYNSFSQFKDRYKWLEDISSEKVSKFVQKENKRTRETLEPLKAFASRVFKEMKEAAACVQHESRVPERHGDFLYSQDFRHIDSLPIFSRAPVDNPEAKEVVLDLEEYFSKDEPQDFVCLGTMKMSPDHGLLAFTVDTEGNEVYRAFVRHVGTGETLSFTAGTHGTGIGSVVLVSQQDAYAIYYSVIDEKLRPFSVFKRTIDLSDGKNLQLSEKAEHVYTEIDESYFLDVNLTKDQRFVLINIHSKQSSEVLLIETCSPTKAPTLVRSREQGREYFVEHANETFYILTNPSPEEDYIFMKTKENPGTDWKAVLEGPLSEPGAKVEDMDSFSRFGVLYERHKGLPRIRVLPWEHPSHFHFVQLPDWAKCSVLSPGVNSHFQSSKVRFTLSSPAVPHASFDYDALSRTLHLNEISSCGDLAERTVCHQVEAESSDGTLVPLTLFHKRDIVLDGKNPTILFGYGAYGMNLELNFKPEWLPLLERGWVLAHAHIRGGGELGKRWHMEGRKLKKMASFDDFIACAEYIIKHKYSCSSKMAAHGVSAGGLVMGYVANNRPDLFQAIVMRAPFLDILNTMKDPELPLTVHEYEEWGDPSLPEVHDFLKKYSPYENISTQEYPWMFISAAINDPRVRCCESLKWAAKIQEISPISKSKIFLNVRANGGHLAAMNTSSYFNNVTMEIAFLHLVLEKM